MTGPLEQHIAEVLARRAEAGPKPLVRDTGHCGRTSCPCTHTAPCDHGWLDSPAYHNPQTGETYETVAPCAICRPDAHDKLAARLRGESRPA